MIGSIFVVLCILGVLAVFLPKNCRQILKVEKDVVVSDVSKSPRTVLQGHHPTCGKFSAHVFHIKEKTFCAACVGLLFGGVLALAVSVIYFFCGWCIGNSLLLVLLGSLGVFLGFFQFKFKNVIRLFVNSGFVLGALFILVGVDRAVQSLVVDLFVVTLIIFWLFTRIFLSQWDHEFICSFCADECCKSDVRKDGS